MENAKGFSLVELMMSVAIIGLLASIAIPNVQIIQEKARQTEAKVALSNVATAEQIFTAEYGQYTSEFDQLSVGFSGTMHYQVGFGTWLPDFNPGAPYHPPPPIGGDCVYNGCDNWSTTTTYAPNSCDPNWQASANWNCSMPFGEPDYPMGTVTLTTFNVEASGLLNSNGFSDIWTLDNTGHLVNVQSGL